jgi:hypothetical protein
MRMRELSTEMLCNLLTSCSYPSNIHLYNAQQTVMSYIIRQDRLQGISKVGTLRSEILKT